jgi:hypothetical protein
LKIEIWFMDRYESRSRLGFNLSIFILF